MASLEELFAKMGQPCPPPLASWEDQVADVCDAYEGEFGQVEISTINIDTAFFVFDHTDERVVIAYAISTQQLMRRDASRIRAFPNVNATVHRIMGSKAFVADKGHFLGHASGGILDINLFPQRREVNRGWSEEGKEFRRMERYVADHPGTFFFNRPIYDDHTWLPLALEYGVLEDGLAWRKRIVPNKLARDQAPLR